ncbi:MAG: methylenetetrahydrofolate reductase [NAD(P)H] [Oscillospiraceae bacterium]|nr:methylenetetrahydrofolate reductase [NAD(P)H] [Oscillospiraceae bacterium]
MKLTELLQQDRLTLSFEVFPPRAGTNFESVKAATEKIAALSPAFVSVTYGAGGGVSPYTLQTAAHLKDTYNVPMLAHLTCVSSTHETVAQQIADMKFCGIENVVALRGDLTPALEASDRNAWPYHHAVELVRELKQAGGFCIGGACYPEVHPESANSREDIAYLKEKVDAGCDFLTTQMFFDNTRLYSFLYRIREAGITVPVVPGIMPITNANQVKRAVRLSGAFVPHRFLSLIDKFGTNPAAMKQAGIAYATEQIIDLYANGIQNIHIYSMNKPDIAEKLMDNLSDILH